MRSEPAGSVPDNGHEYGVPIPADTLEGIRAAVDAYELDLAANDVPALEQWFVSSDAAMRVDADAVLVGRQAIDKYRRASSGAPQRSIDRIHIVPVQSDVVVAITEFKRLNGDRGLQTQVWVHTREGWRIMVAHVSVDRTLSSATGAVPETETIANDPRIWRLKGDPLIKGAESGPLQGLTVAVKDIFAVKGNAIGLGNPTWLECAPIETANAAVVDTLLSAGADIVGITQTDEFAFSLAGTNVHYGTPPNPAAPGRVPGGSSSGSASAVAHGFVEVGIGTDTAGSVRIPASYCRLYGLRTSHGMIPGRGLVPFSPSFDAVGWMTRYASSLDRVARVLLPKVEVAPLKRIILADDLFELAEQEQRAFLLASARRIVELLNLELEVVPKFCAGQLDTWLKAFGTVQPAEAWQSFGSWVGANSQAIEPEIAERFEVGRSVTAIERAEAERMLLHARSFLWDRIPAGTGMIQPAASTPPPPLRTTAEEKAALRAGTRRLMAVGSISGLPVLTIPTGGPIGLCIVGPRGSDTVLTALAGKLENIDLVADSND